MGQNYCQCSDQGAIPTKIPKCSLLHRQLLSKFELPQRQVHSGVNSEQLDKVIPKSSNKLPSQYIQLLLGLCSNKNKYTDIYFPCQNWIISTNTIGRVHWARVSQVTGIKNNQNLKRQSKFGLIYDFLKKNYPSFCEEIKPIYIAEFGFAICKYYINGNQTEVIIDDFIPESFYNPKIQPWIHLMEKGYAKVLGSYHFIDSFTIGEIFTEVTGVPYYIAEESSNDQKIVSDDQSKWVLKEKNTFNNFKDALKCDQILYQTRRFKNDVSVFGYRKNFQLSTISFTSKVRKNNLLRFQIPNKQTISLRICQQNNKYKDQIDGCGLESYSKIFVQLFQDSGSNMNRKPFGVQHRFNNCIYIDNFFTDIPPGKYIFYIQSIEKDLNLSFLAYSSSKIKITEIFQERICKQFLLRGTEGRFPNENIAYKQISYGVFVSINLFGSIICMKFEKNYPKKKMKIAHKQYYFHQEKQRKVISLDNVANRWVYILKCNDQKQKICNEEDFFQIL